MNTSVLVTPQACAPVRALFGQPLSDRVYCGRHEADRVTAGSLMADRHRRGAASQRFAAWSLCLSRVIWICCGIEARF